MTKISVAESTEEALENVTVMSHKFLIPYRGTALMHVIGPIEMDYRRMVSLVNVISRVLVMKLTDYYRYLNSNHYEVFLSRNVLKNMIQESLINGLKEEGIEEIAADGEFDHNFHMAIQTMPADDEHPADTIAQVFQKGYKLHDRILRPAMVVVYKEN